MRAKVTMIALAMAALATSQATAAPSPVGQNRGGPGRQASWTLADAPSSTVVARHFAPLFHATTGGQVYAQPVVAGGSVIAADEADHVTAIDPDTGSVRWQRSLGEPVPAVEGCGDLVPTYGITSTPVVDPKSGDLFVMAERLGRQGPRFDLHRLRSSDGEERPGFPVRVSGSASNQAGTTFDAGQQLQRPGLLLLGGRVWAAFASHCDHVPYDGWVVGIPTAGGSPTLWASEPADRGFGGIWQSGAALSSDGAREILLTTGNGDAPTTPTAGSAGTDLLGDAVVRLRITRGGGLKATDFFVPYDAAMLSELDLDLGSSGLTVLPPQVSGPGRHLAFTGAKGGTVYLLDLDGLGGMSSGPGGGDAIVDQLWTGGRILSTPSASKATGLIYVSTLGATSVGSPAGAAGRGIVALKVETGSGAPRLVVAGRGPDDLGMGSGSPTLTQAADGSRALAWVVRCPVMPAVACSDASLDVYDQQPVDGSLVEVASIPIGAGTKFSQPLPYRGRIYVGAADGLVAVGQAARGPVKLRSSFQPSSPSALAGSEVTGELRVSLGAPSALSGVEVSDPAFVVDAAAMAEAEATPATSFTLPVRVDTTAFSTVGEHSALATVRTTSDAASTTMVLRTTPTGPMLREYRPPFLGSLGAVADGQSRRTTFTLTNIGSAPAEVTALCQLSAPFSVISQPALGSSIDPGQVAQLVVSVTGSAGMGLARAICGITAGGLRSYVRLSATTP